MKKERVILIAKFAVAGALIFFLLYSGKLDFRQLRSVGESWPWLFLALVPFGSVLFLAGVRWRILMEAQGIRYGMRDTFSLVLIGWFFNQMMIGTTGGDIVKAYTVAVEQPRVRGAAVMSVLFDRALGLFVLLAVALAALCFNWRLVSENPQLTWFAGILTAVFCVTVLGGLLFYSDRVRSFVRTRELTKRIPLGGVVGRLSEALYIYKYHRKSLLYAILASIGLHTCVVLTNVCLAFALGVTTAVPVFFFIIPIAHIAMAIPINPPGAIGTGEAIYDHLFNLVGSPHGAMLCLLQRFAYCFWALLGCVVYLRRKGKVQKAVEQAKAAAGETGGEAGPEEPADDDDGRLAGSGEHRRAQASGADKTREGSSRPEESSSASRPCSAST